MNRRKFSEQPPGLGSWVPEKTGTRQRSGPPRQGDHRSGTNPVGGGDPTAFQLGGVRCSWRASRGLGGGTVTPIHLQRVPCHPIRREALLHGFLSLPAHLPAPLPILQHL